MLLNHRPAIFIAVIAASLMAVTPPVEAGWLCDWLCGHHASVQPVVPVAPVPAAASPPSYSAGYAPVAAAAVPTAAAPAQTSYFAPPATAAPAPVTSYSPPVTTYSPPVSDSGAVAAQVPASNAAMPATLPTGYAGLYSSYYGTTPQRAVAAPAPVTSFYGTGNVYPDTQATTPGVVTANYAAARPQAIINPQPHHGLLGGIGRFFGSLFGTRYRTSYYPAAVTQYRPVTTVSPTTGAANVVQQPCTTYENQVQRSPISSYQGTPTAPGTCGTTAPMPAAAAPASGFSAAPSGEGVEGFVPQPTLPSDSFDPYGSQRPGYEAYSNGTQPPTSYAPSNGSASDCPPTNPSPLTGSPSNGEGNGSRFNGGSEAADRQPVEQPQINSAPSSSLRGYRQFPENGTSTNRSGWRQSAPLPETSEPVNRQRSARPIPAPRSTWPTPVESTDDHAGRTATHKAWSSKQIQWASHKQAAQPDTQDRASSSRVISEPGADAGSTVRRANHIAEPAAPNDRDQVWQSNVPPRSVKSSSWRPAAAPRSHRERPRYDDSGWE